MSFAGVVQLCQIAGEPGNSSLDASEKAENQTHWVGGTLMGKEVVASHLLG